VLILLLLLVLFLLLDWFRSKELGGVEEEDGLVFDARGTVVDASSFLLENDSVRPEGFVKSDKETRLSLLAAVAATTLVLLLRRKTALLL